jgi:hypothetical protein
MFSLGFLWNRCSVMRRFGSQTLVTGQNGHNFLSNHWIALKVFPEFPEAVFLGVAMESQLGDEEVWSSRLE